MGRKILLLALITSLALNLKAQEMQAKVTVLAQQLGSSVNKNMFNTLQTQLTNMINTRKWTKDVFQTQEKSIK